MADTTTPDLLRGAIAGVIAGLTASYAMNAFQAALAKLGTPSGASETSSTDKAANVVAHAATGHDLTRDARAAGGQIVHYAVGAALGLGYGVAAEVRPEVRRGFGTGFGLATATLLDEAAVPIAGLSGPPSDTPAIGHAYAVASHLVFGAALEASRRLVRALA